MHIRPASLILLLVIFLYPVFSPVFVQAQGIYIYPNKRLCDEGKLEYKRYTPAQARAYEQGGSFAPYLVTGWGNERRLTTEEDPYAPKVVTVGDSIFFTYQTIYLNRIYFIRSTDGGIDWNRPILLADTMNYELHYYPEIIL